MEELADNPENEVTKQTQGENGIENVSAGDSEKETTRASEEKFDEICVIPRDWPLFDQNFAYNAFYSSQFYDRKSNNEEIKAQNLPVEALVKMTGIEYMIQPNDKEPRLFIIVKQDRVAETRATKRALYYILDNVIYQAPNIRQVLLRRIRTASENLTQSVNFFLDNRSFSSVDGRAWNFPGDTAGLWKDSFEALKYKDKQQIKRVRRDIKTVDRALKDTLSILGMELN